LGFLQGVSKPFFPEPSTLGREIKLAQTLLERSHCEFHDDSLRCGAVDDLLIEPHANFQV